MLLQGRSGNKFKTKHGAAKRKYGSNFGSTAVRTKFAPR